MDSSEHYLSTLQAGRSIGVNKSTIRRWAIRKVLPYTMIDGRRYFKKEDVLRCVGKKEKAVEKNISSGGALSFFKWFTVGTGLLAMVFLFLSTIPYKEDAASPVKPQGTQRSFLPTRISFQEVVMAAATDSADAAETSLQFFDPKTDVAGSMNVQKQTTKGSKKSQNLPVSGYYDTAESYIAGFHGKAGPVAVITKTDTLALHPFFTNAHEGDKLFVYQDEKKALLFRPLTNQVIAFGSLDDVPTSIYQTKENYVVMVHNRSGRPYDRTLLETEIQKAYGDTLIITGDTAAHADHTKTLVIAANGDKKAVAQAIAKKLGALYTTLPSDELQPPIGVDVLILIGKDRK